ncbi:fasciclin domain-containing protein [Lacibacter sediminis]|uniref:Fasciclin domain-containing protein n=1 Tax=Lacibacter sediminis TaxID=2760713 RepID=A0A7G5XB02_9BACT|nr:fasciclin domain-containing protein [Lacibacter sediminis]QNA42655.1 fasciclin domain-containing protein [Lacibacter sediminis]
MKSRYKSLLLVALGTMLLYGCSKVKEERNAITDESLKITLFELVNANPDLSTFAKYLVQTGYDKVLNSSKSFTVYAPVNSALATLDPAIVNDAAKLKLFVGNHIAGQLYRTADVPVLTRVGMLNSKYNNLKGTQIGDAVIKNADKYAANGLLQVIDKFLPALDNSWEVLSTSADIPLKQKAFMLSLFRNVFDTSNAIIIGVHPTTGEPIYQPGTDSVYTNLFWNRVHDLKNEQKQYTLFVLTDAAWDSEVTKFKPYYVVTNNADSNTLVTSWNVVKDFAVDTLYGNPSAIPDTITSEFGTKLPVERSAIVKTIKTSNGIVYIMSKMNVLPASKMKTILIEGESYTSTNVDRRGNTYFRDRINTLTGKDFRDVLVLGHNSSGFNIRYELKEIPSIKYKAYWMAYNDFQTATYTQKLAIGTVASATFAMTNVVALNFNEIYLGEFTMSQYAPLYNIYLVANGTNPIVCDYIKLVPSL